MKGQFSKRSFFKYIFQVLCQTMKHETIKRNSKTNNFQENFAK